MRDFTEGAIEGALITTFVAVISFIIIKIILI